MEATEKYRVCYRCGQNRAIKFYSSPRGKVCRTCSVRRTRTNTRNRRIFDTYGLTPAEYDLMFVAQGGKCAICWGTRRQRLSVDHRHSDGVIRGLLCRRCNGTLLPAAKDTAAILYRAAKYLNMPPCDKVLGRRYVPVKEAA